MSTHLIKINLKSIKKNKDAGMTMTLIPTHQTYTASFTVFGTEIPKEFDGCDAQITSYSSVGHGAHHIELVLGSLPTDFDKLRGIEDLIVNIDNGIQPIHHAPIPKYSYDYLSSKVKCNECGKSFKHTELLHTLDQFGDNDNYYATEICPHCNSNYCCDLEFEEIEEALKRKKK
jgi:hypothetical protein